MGGEPLNNMPQMDNQMMTPEPGMEDEPDMNMPPQDNEMMGGNEMSDEMPMNNGMGMEGDNEMSAEGDASSEIQSMAGKLANSLRNTENVNDKKFAAGMINAAAIEGLSSQDRKDIIKKIKSNEGDEMIGEQFVFTKKQINEIQKEIKKK
jgi:hypothetical protein